MSNVAIRGTFGGTSIGGVASRDADGLLILDPEIAVAKVGQLTMRTDNDTGVITMVAGHLFILNDIIDVYWINTDGTTGIRRNMVAGSPTGDAVPVDGGTGDNLPLVNTAITASEKTGVSATISGNNLKMCAAVCPVGAVLQFNAVGAGPPISLRPKEPFVWHTDNNFTNPLAAINVTVISVSQSDSSDKHKIVMGFEIDV